MKRQLFAMAIAAFCAVAMMAGQQVKADVLWDAQVNNGLGMVLVTHPGGMVSGADRSAIAVGGTSFGAGAQLTANNRVADSFTVGGLGWNVDSLQFFVYQTGATAASITGINVRIWSGNPGNGDGSGGTVAWAGGLFDGTNGMTNSMTNIFRTDNATNTGTTRQIQSVNVSGLNVALAPGTYNLDWSLTGTVASGPWQPQLGLLGATGLVPGNAWQAVTAANAPFLPLEAGAVGAFRASLPFVINGTVIPEPGTLSLLAIGTVVGMLRRRK